MVYWTKWINLTQKLKKGCMKPSSTYFVQDIKYIIIKPLEAFHGFSIGLL